MSTVKGLDTCYSATYMSHYRDQQRFTISEVAVDWHEPMVPQRIMWHCHPLPAVRLADTPSPQSATLGLHPVAVAYSSFRVPLTVGGLVGLTFDKHNPGHNKCRPTTLGLKKYTLDV